MIETECRVLALSTVSFQQKNNIYIYEPKRNIKKKKEDKKKFHFFVKEESPLFNTTRQNRFVTKQMCNLYINVNAVEHDNRKREIGWLRRLMKVGFE